MSEVYANKQFRLNVVSVEGVRTGKCIESAANPAVKTCEIFAWCPAEIDQLPM
jgi:ATP P2X receptor